MNTLQRKLYAAVLRLHPAAFRNQFGREMALDFEDALASSGFASLCLDALLSLGRQWTAHLLPCPTEQLPARRLSLLAGDYVMLSPGGPPPFAIARASILATLLLFGICFMLSASSRRTPIDLPIGSGSQAKGIHSSAQHHPYAAGYRTGTSTTHPAATEVLGPAGSLRSPGSASGEAEDSSPGSIGPSVIDPELKKYLWQFAAFIELVWILALLLYKRPGIAKKIVFALFGLTAFAAPLAFASAVGPFFFAEVQPPPKPELLLFHPSGPPLSYDVATVKPLSADAAAGTVKLPPGTSLNPYSVRRYLMDAYGASYPVQIAGGPDWLKDAFLIHGKVPDDLEAASQKMTRQQRIEQARAMQQSLLAERFHLVAHFETRVLPVYALVPAKGGLKIVEVPQPPEPKPGDPPMHLGPGDSLPPGSSRTMFNSSGLRVLNARAIKMQLLARIIGPDAGDRPIVNHTGFSGCFDVTDLTWAPLGDAAADNAPDAPSLTMALEKTLGIKLVPAQAPIEVLVIDRIDKPTEN